LRHATDRRRSFLLPAGSTTKEAFIAAIEEMAARAIAAKQEPEGQQPNASPAAAATSKSPG
jgi:hypothetical protein